MNTTQSEILATSTLPPLAQAPTDITQASESIAAALGQHMGMAALPDNYTRHDLEAVLPNRRRLRGNFKTPDITSFVQYSGMNAETGAVVLVAAEGSDLKATTVLNYGTPALPGHADNTARLVLEPTAAYAALLGINGRQIGQKTAAEWLEDWREHASAFRDDAEITLRHAIAAVRDITIESAKKVDSTVEDLRESRSTFEQVQASNKDGKLPNLLYFQAAPYEGFDSRTFVLRVAVHTGDSLTLKLSVQQMELHREAIAKEFVAKVQDAFAMGLPDIEMPVLQGEYSTKA